MSQLVGKVGPKCVLWNLHYAKPLADLVNNQYDKYIREAQVLLPDVVGQFTRWSENLALHLMAVDMVLCEELE